MRIEKEYNIKDLKVTIFYWNNKYLLKVENAMFEQTYKFSELDFTLAEVEELITDDFITGVKKIFYDMFKNLQQSSS
ncbi:MAG: hypothetical protein ACNS60_05120 [Candidatus Cyclobacteriaceae bacterium M2_1C_046]